MAVPTADDSLQPIMHSAFVKNEMSQMAPRAYYTDAEEEEEERDSPPPSSSKIYHRSVTQLREKKARRLQQLEALTTALRQMELDSPIQSPKSIQSDFTASAKPMRRPPSAATARRLQEGLARSDHKRRSKETRFLLLTQKAEAYSRRRASGDEWSLRSSPDSPTKSVKPSPSLLDSLYSMLPKNQSEEEQEDTARDDEETVDKEVRAREEIMRLKREHIRRKLRARRAAQLAAAEQTAAAEAAEIASMASTMVSTIATQMGNRLAKALKMKKKKKKRVRFCHPLVTEIKTRPYTRPEDIEKLYFIEEELDELEWDRAHVEGDQFEVIVEDELTEDESVAASLVSVTYKNKRALQDRVRRTVQSQGKEAAWISLSPSDLSAIYE